MRRLHHMSISREGVMYLAVMGVILTASVIRQINLMMLLYGILAGPLLLSWRLVRRTLKQVDVVRRVPRSVFAGEPFTVELEVSNNKRRGGSFAIVARDECGKRGGGKPAGVDVYFPYVAAGKSVRGTYQTTLPLRGVYDFQPIKISSRFPLGLLKTMLRLDKPQRLLVLPQLGKLSPLWQRLWRSEEDSHRGSRRRDGMQEGDFYGLREWRSGDARSRIHWRTSARRQTLTVRQYERKRQFAVALVVDLWEPPRATDDDRRRVEQAIRFAATVVAEICKEPDRELLLEIVGKQARTIRGLSSPQLRQECLQELAAAEATRDDRLPAALPRIFMQMRSGANAIVVGSRTNDLTDRTRFAALAARPELQVCAARTACLTPGDDHWDRLFQAPETVGS